MSKPAGRFGDIGSGHGKCPPTPIISGSSDVIINGKAAARQGDSLVPHCKHGRSIAEGSSTVFINGKPAARVGDAISCGGKVVIGSGNVFIGDNPVLIQTEALQSTQGEPATTREGNRQQAEGRSQNTPPPNANIQPREYVKLEEEIREPEFKDAVIRIDILPEQATGDTFNLAATDGSYNATKSVKDDLIPGDSYLDLLFETLDTSKRYRLTHHCSQTGKDYIYFDNLPYGSI